MSTNHTPNYGLSQWEKTDKVLMEDFNADNAKLDDALTALSAALDGKASLTALSGLQSSVFNLSSAVSQKGTCNVETFTYTGTGQCREACPTVISFKKVPVAFLVFGPDAFITGAGCSANCFFVAAASGVSMGQCTGSWNGVKYSFCTHNSYPAQQANTSGKTYTVIAFYTA